MYCNLVNKSPTRCSLFHFVYFRKLAYVGQTSRNLKQRYQEHIRYIRNNDPQSAYALHILKNQHEYGPMADTMSLLKHEQKTPMLIPYEQLFI